MPAYVISEVEMRDAAGFEAYRAIAAETIARYGGSTSFAAAQPPAWKVGRRRRQ